jgi:hypothetical protein
MQSASALKTMMDSFRSAVGLVREIQQASNSDADPGQRAALESALSNAEAAAKVAEAEVAKAFGYELCKCDFPPSLCRLLQRHQNASILGQGRAGLSSRSAGRNNKFTPDPGRASSSLHSGLGFRYTQVWEGKFVAQFLGKGQSKKPGARPGFC